MALPTIFEDAGSLIASVKAGGAQRLAENVGTTTVVRVYATSGLTSTYTRTLAAHLSGIVVRAAWTHARIGGAGRAEILVKGGLADMDTAVQNEYEVELERGDPVVWYRGRVVGYKYETQGAGAVNTRLFCEGYLTKLAQLKIDKDYTSSTVKVIVTDILDTYVTPNTRIAYTASDVVGAYTVNSVSFKGRTVLEAFEMLGMMQGSTEWGVTEGNPKPQFYFLAEGSGTSEAQVLQFGKDAVDVTAEGSFESGYSTVKVIGGYGSTGAIVTGSYTDATAQTSFGKREKVISDSAVLNASDADRLAQNYATVYANGNGRYRVKVVSPDTRIEPDRTSGSISAAKKATIRGIDGAQVTDFFGMIQYEYTTRDGGASQLTAEVYAGLSEECVQNQVARLDRTVQSLVQQAQQGPAVYSGATLTDAGPVALTVHNAGVQTQVLTAAADRTIDADTGGTFGQRLTVAIQSDAAVARTITFGTNFRPNGTLTTPATASKYVAATFESDGTSWIETGRQTGGA